MSIIPFKRLLCANRGEIAIRVFRASTELGFRTVAIFSEEDRVHLHRYKADEAYLVGKGLEPVAAYLAEDEIIELAKRHEIDAIHPGYGLLSERASFARKCRDAGIVFIGPTPEAIDALGDKIAARKIAEAAGVPVVPGTPEPLRTLEAARAFADKAGYPVLVKAAAGGGGRGMRVVRSAAEMGEALDRARSEAKKAFGDDSVFLEKLVVRPKHIEVQVLGDNHGHLVHLHERDCSVQRRYQKVVEYAPAWSLPEALRARLAQDALKVARHAHYTQRRHRRVPGRRGRQPLLHRGQPAHPGRAHGHRGDHRPRPGAGADPHRAGLQAVRPRDRHPQPGVDPAPRRRDPGARHRRGSQERLPARHRQDLGLPAGDRPRHPARRRLGLRRRARVAVLRFAAREDHRRRAWSGTTPGARPSARCASSASAASRPTSTSSRTCSRTRRSSTARRTPRSSTRRRRWRSTRRAAIARRASCATWRRRWSTATPPCAASPSRRPRC